MQQASNKSGKKTTEYEHKKDQGGTHGSKLDKNVQKKTSIRKIEKSCTFYLRVVQKQVLVYKKSFCLAPFPVEIKIFFQATLMIIMRLMCLPRFAYIALIHAKPIFVESFKKA